MKMPNNTKGILKKVRNHFPGCTVCIEQKYFMYSCDSHITTFYSICVVDGYKTHAHDHLTFDELKQKASDIIDGNI